MLGVECGERFVEVAGVVIVEEQPYPDTAVGGSAQRIEQQRAREVVVPDVVLHVEAALGDIRKPNQRGERIASTEQGNNARQAGMRLGERSDRPTEPALAGVLQPGGNRAVVQWGQERATLRHRKRRDGRRQQETQKSRVHGCRWRSCEAGMNTVLAG